MRRSARVLTWLACASQGRRVETSTHQFHSRSTKDKGKPYPFKAVAGALLAFTHPAAFNAVSCLQPPRNRAGHTSMSAEKLPYGSWPSPVTASFITSSTVPLGNLKVNSKGELCWLERRPKEGGRQVVCRYNKASPAANERGGVDQTPKDANVRTRVHEYGGGEYTLHPVGGVIYSDFMTQRLFWSKYDDAPPVPLTPEEGPSGWATGSYRFADGQVDPSGTRLICVREDHGEKGDLSPAEVVNEIVSVALDGSGEMLVLATGRDFYSAPRVSPSGSHLAYLTWDHPSMPWDATELRVVRLSNGTPNSSDTSSHDILDGTDKDTSVLQPAWHPGTGSLYYISDTSGFHNLMRVAPPLDGKDLVGPGTSILPREVDFGGPAPGWAFGQQGYSFLGDGRVAAYYPDRSTGRTQLVVFDEDTSGASDVPAAVAASSTVHGETDGLPFMFGGLASSPDGTLYMVGGGPDIPSGVYAWRGLASGEDAAAKPELLACSSSSRIPDGYVSTPKFIEFPTVLGTCYGYYYPPTNPTANSDEAAPPCLFKMHGGPTSCTSASYNPTIQFFTSRGFAVFDVDFGGSTGYGREYRRRLRGQWGIVDIDDACAGAKYLVEQGLADPERLAIDGGSAGGYSTLSALTFRDVFKAGCSQYGISDLTLLAEGTAKFESRYLDGLIGKLPEDKAVYDSRSALQHLDQLSCPVLFVHGAQDKIVPPNQAESMHAELLKKGKPTALKMYMDEQHGFRKAKNIEDALNSEFYFYSKIFGFTAAGEDIKPFEIDNMA